MAAQSEHIKQKMQIELQEKEGLVAFGDVAGVTAMSHEECRNFIYDMEHLFESFRKTVKSRSVITAFILDDPNIEIEYRLLNDTIILTWSFSRSLEGEGLFFALIEFTGLINALIFNLFRKRKNMPGVVGYGKYFVSNNLLIGDAILDAARNYKNLNLSTWVLTPSLGNKVTKVVREYVDSHQDAHHLSNFKSLIFEYPVPMKKEKEYTDKNENVCEPIAKMWCLGWPLNYLRSRDWLYFTGKNTEYGFETDYMNCIPDPRLKPKVYRNTIDFFKFYEANIFKYYLEYLRQIEEKNKNTREDGFPLSRE